MNRIFLLLSFCATLLCGCKPKATADRPEGDQPLLTVSIEPLRYLVEAIAGPHYRVVTLVPGGSSPETYEPTPRQIVALTQSVAYFAVGDLGFERTWLPRLRQNAPEVTFVNTSEGIAPVPGQHHHHGGEVHGDPHVWTSPQHYAIMAAAVCQALSRLNPQQAPAFASNLQRLEQQLQHTHDSITGLLQHCSHRTFLIYHPALTCYASQYGLRQIPIEYEGKEPSAAQLAQLTRLCRDEHIRTILVQEGFDTRNAMLLAHDTDTRIASVNPLAYDWPQEMIRIAHLLAQP